MGYNTSYNLNVFKRSDDNDLSVESWEVPEIVKEVLEDEIKKLGVFDGDGDCDYGFCGWTTWYDHEEDMRMLSRKFPDLVFCLHGAGDNAEDLWDKYFVNGRMQECYAKITYDDFDPAKLDEGNIKMSDSVPHMGISEFERQIISECREDGIQDDEICQWLQET